ncbi:hypothetical protein B0H14DRAFT_3433917 [Mycena olivaceomarginata]|nr:hypothetical protein B0H14DRAFT_3433917 [Mycena olivaceomarginata]
MAHADRSHEAVDAVLVFTVNDGMLPTMALPPSLLRSMESTRNLNLRNWYRHRHVEPHARNIPMLPRGQFSDEQYPSLSTHKQVQVTVSTHQQVQVSDQKPGLDDIPAEC